MTILWIILGVIWVFTTVFWTLQMFQALDLVSSTAKMKPQNVWFTFIPFFGLYWQFAVVIAVGDSLGEEYRRRGIIARESRPGYNVGMTANILLCCAVIPTFGILVAIISNITRLIHLAKIKNYTKELENIIQTQMQYAIQTTPIAFTYQPEINPSIEENLQKNNPNRFMPPMTPEENEERWRKKN
jgi:predicted RNA-binding protein with RPS1 domain